MSIKNIIPDPKYKGGIYKPLNPDKYIGQMPIICRSSWERKYCQFCDLKDEIVKWASEPFKIKYYNPITGKEHDYYPDFYIKVAMPDGSYKEYIVEIKPKNYLKKPIPPKKNTTKSLNNYKYLYETFIKNFAKAEATKKFASERKMEFIILTEDSLK